MDLSSIDWKNLFELVGAAVAALAGIGAVYRFIWPRFRKWAMKFVGYGRISDQLEDIRKTFESRAVAQDEVQNQKLGEMSLSLTSIVKELRPNGGTSMKDALSRIERRQLLSEQRQKALVADMDTGVFESNSHGEYIWVNRTLCRLTGRSHSELLGRGWVNIIDPAEREGVVEEWNAAVMDEREFEKTYSLVNTDGDRVRVLVRSTRMIDTEGKVLGYFGIARPLT